MNKDRPLSPEAAGERPGVALAGRFRLHACRISLQPGQIPPPMPPAARRPLLAGLAALLLPGIRPAQSQAPAVPGVGQTMPPAVTVGEWRLGALFPFTGPFALMGDEAYRGLEMAADERNEAGGLAGRQIRLLRGDASDQTQAVSEVRRLTSGEGRVACVFGTTISALALAASQVTEALGTPYFELGAIADALTARGARFVFRSCPRAMEFGRLSVDAVADRLAPAWKADPRALRIAILAEDGPYGQSVAAAQEDRLRARGIPLAVRLSFPSRTTDLGTLLGQLRTARAEVVLHSAYPGDVVPFFRAMREARWQPRMVIGAGGAYSLSDTARSLGQEIEGVMNVDVTPFATDEAAAPGVGSFAEAYKRKYGAEPRSGHSLATYAGAAVFLEALSRAGTAEKERLRAAVLATDLPEGKAVTGWGALFDESGQNTRARPLLAQWQEGRLVTVAPAPAAVGALRGSLGAARAATP
ncbi:Leucine-, isoleucine-, valine-, threonine-, and alanine-binding protein [Roseomonas mucosa]|nr:amino acid-binding protein [Roseomonas sp. FDAARGOS_362]UZO98250.1 Leucine-, isoleucine-, valine-, threonine-, and alanine-binding protein [Roseomonas mucosa]